MITNKGFILSGKVTMNGIGLANVVMNGLPRQVLTDWNGGYTTSVDENWSGKVTPSLSGHTFTPAFIEYNTVLNDQIDQDYTATHNTGDGGDSDSGGGGGGGCFIGIVAP